MKINQVGKCIVTDSGYKQWMNPLVLAVSAWTNALWKWIASITREDEELERGKLGTVHDSDLNKRLTLVPGRLLPPALPLLNHTSEPRRRTLLVGGSSSFVLMYSCSIKF